MVSIERDNTDKQLKSISYLKNLQLFNPFLTNYSKYVDCWISASEVGLLIEAEGEEIFLSPENLINLFKMDTS